MTRGESSIIEIEVIKETKLPLISIITVVHNGEKHMQACIDTVKAQEYPNIEHIILDGASTDGTVQILENNNDKIAFWHSESDGGIYDAMNKAIAYCSGDWYMFLGVDDLLLPGFSDLAKLLIDKNTAYYGCVVYKGEVQYDTAINQFKIVRSNICHQALLYPRTVFDKHRYNIDYKIAADNVLLLELWKEKKINFEYHEIIVSNFNHTGVSGTDWDRLFFKNRGALIFSNLGLLPYFYHLYLSLSEKVKKKVNKRVSKIKKLFEEYPPY